MDCQTAREVISAQLDGEPIHDPDSVAAHLLACAGCAGWRASAADLTVAARTAGPQPPDLTVSILEATAAQDEAVAAKRKARYRVLRVAVGALAVAQLVLAIPALLTAAGVVSLDAVHASREMASFDIAVAVGFLLAAFRPERARAFVPVACVLSACLAATSGVDLLAGATGVWDESSHLVAVVQAGLLWALGRFQPPAVVKRSARTANI